MFCQNCNEENPDGAVMCALCGEPLVKKPASSPFSYSSMSYDEPTVSSVKKGNNALTSTIIFIVVLILSIGFVAIRSGWKYNGEYEIYSVRKGDMEITIDSIRELTALYPTEIESALGTNDFAISGKVTISFGKFNFDAYILGEEKHGSSKVVFSGKNFKLPNTNGLTGYYDEELDAIILKTTNSSDGELVFKKK